MKNDVRAIGDISRRNVLSFTLPLAVGLIASPALAGPARGVRSLSLRHRHTGESVTADYWIDGWYDPDALAEIDRVLRDFRADQVRSIDRKLLDLLHRVGTELGSDVEFEIFSAYRSPKTNAALAKRRSGVARKSLHIQGQAVDVTLPGRRLRDVRRAAKALRAGGVGYYPRSGFVHLDVGPVRYWS